MTTAQPILSQSAGLDSTSSGNNRKRKVVCDIETDGLKPTRIWVATCIDYDTGELFSFKEEDLATRFAEFSATVGTWVGHNFLSFDTPAINRLTPVKIKVTDIVDTLILSRMDDPGRRTHSLEWWGSQLGHPKVEHNDWSHYSEAMLTRNVEDVRLNVKVYRELLARLKDFSKFSIDLEHRTQYILDKSRKHGFYLDKDAAMAIYHQCGVEADEIERKIHEFFPPQLKMVEQSYTPRFNKDGTMSLGSHKKITKHVKSTENNDGTYSLFDEEVFNLGSPKQVVERLNTAGWKPYLLTPSGQPRVCDENLATVPDEAAAAKQLSLYLTLRSRQKVINNWMDHYDPITHSVHGDIISLGASTHRMAHRNPQMGNIPAVRSLHGKAMRACWTVDDPESYSLLGVDIEGIQLRILAHYMKNPDYAKAIAEGVTANGTDVHSVNRDVLREAAPATDRDVAKTFIYALILGAGDAKLGQILGGDSDLGRRAKENMFRRIEGFTRIKRMCYDAANRGYATMVDGRRVRIPNAHYALAIYLQCNEAIVMKNSLVLTDARARHLDWNLLTVVHDETQSKVRNEQAMELGRIQIQSIVDSGEQFKLGIPLSGSMKIGKNWADCH